VGRRRKIMIDKPRKIKEWKFDEKTPLADLSSEPTVDNQQGFIGNESRKRFLMGEGNYSIRMNYIDGLWLGAEQFANAPFRVSMKGRMGGKKGSQTLGAGVTTFAVSSDLAVITGDAGANTIATITGGVEGQVLKLLFVDALVTISDDNTHAADTCDLSAAFTSADDKTLTLIYDGTSWYELCRSTN
jgi:hypothetical protein